jgi:hypothetical protein
MNSVEVTYYLSLTRSWAHSGPVRCRHDSKPEFTRLHFNLKASGLAGVPVTVTGPAAVPGPGTDSDAAAAA